MKQADLLDVNVWVALADENHTHHQKAREYWVNQSAPKIAFTRVTMLGMIRLLINPVVMQNKPFALAEAISAYKAFRALPEVIWLDEEQKTAAHVDSTLAQWAASDKLTPQVWTDSYLASLAIATECRIVSFDGDFKRFNGLSLLRLI